MVEMVLLGAGASVDAKIPAARQMTQEIVRRLEEIPAALHSLHALRFIVGGLLFQKGISNEDPYGGADIEEVLGAIQSLRDRHTLEVAPFVSLWHPMVQALESPDDISAYEQGAISSLALAESPPLSDGTTDLGSFSNWLEAQPVKQTFDMTARVVDHVLMSLVWIKRDGVDRVDHLRPLLSVLDTQRRLVIATLNYDNTIEFLAQSGRRTCNTGLDEWLTTGTFATERHEGLVLLKLHGSIDWAWEGSRHPPAGRLPDRRVRQVDTAELEAELIEERQKPGTIAQPRRFEPAIIFGQRNKLTADGPFLDLLRAFKEELGASSRLTVVGYSFRDEHVNRFIAQWMNGSQDRTMRIINGKEFRSTNVDFARDLLSLPEGRVEVLELSARDGIEHCFGPASPAQ